MCAPPPPQLSPEEAERILEHSRNNAIAALLLVISLAALTGAVMVFLSYPA